MKNAISLIRSQKGLSLIELIITMAIIVIVLTMNTSTLGVALKQSKQQMQAAGAGMDKIAALDVVRMDIEHAGYGLPWSFQNAINYAEAVTAGFNDAPSNAPCALKSNNSSGYNNSDYLVIKSTIVGSNATAPKWNYIVYPNTTVGSTGSPNNFVAGERVIVLWANASGGLDKQLIMNGGVMFTTMTDGAGTIPSSFRPVTASQSFVVYGVDSGTDLSMPFNRVDYYIAQPAAGMPQGCAPGTGVLFRATVNQGTGALNAGTPLLDCVADMQVAYGLDTDGNGVVDAHSNDISALNAANIRAQVKEVRVYVLSHEGAIDKAFSYNNDNNGSIVRVGDAGLGLGRNFDLSVTGTNGIDWRNYRWKLDKLVVRTRNIAN